MKGMGVCELLSMVPESVLEKIGSSLGVDKPNQKLTGAMIYKLLLYTLAKNNRMSLRVMEFIYESAIFQNMAKCRDKETRHSSISDRLRKIPCEYFADIFKHLVDTYDKQLPEKDARNVYRFDSTMISLSANLFAGMDYGNKKDTSKLNSFLKVSVGLKGHIPAFVKFYTEQSYASEDIALKKTIKEASISPNDFVIFDRGIASAKTFSEFYEHNITFITRINPERKVKVVKTIESATEETGRKTDSLVILKDQKIKLCDSDSNTFFGTTFRLIRARSLSTNEELRFLTSDFTTDAIEITELYKKRWDIEVFFRFIKQELNFKHFLARDLNGLQSYLYMVLILSILFLVYKIKNNKSGYKIAKMYFTQEIENEITAEIVKACGGDPLKFRERYCPETIPVIYV